METRVVCGELPGVLALKPSLVEWKRVATVLPMPIPTTLKPSLVEWKPFLFVSLTVNGSNLETFLGGMETVLIQ